MSPHDPGPELMLYDPDSASLLATGMELSEADTTGHCFACIRGNGILLTYYFGKGRRHVMVRHGADEGVTAQLGTRWVAGRREWVLEW
ncbi:MAG: hypothetical protein ABI577_11065 [bacterium]